MRSNQLAVGVQGFVVGFERVVPLGIIQCGGQGWGGLRVGVPTRVTTAPRPRRYRPGSPRPPSAVRSGTPGHSGWSPAAFAVSVAVAPPWIVSPRYARAVAAHRGLGGLAGSLLRHPKFDVGAGPAQRLSRTSRTGCGAPRSKIRPDATLDVAELGVAQVQHGPPAGLRVAVVRERDLVGVSRCGSRPAGRTPARRAPRPVAPGPTRRRWSRRLGADRRGRARARRTAAGPGPAPRRLRR